MSKRGASEQITRENHLDHESDDEPKSIKSASASVLAKRKILKPRGRTPGSSVASSASPAPSFGSSATGNSGLFGNATAQDGLKGAEQPGVKPFTFGSSGQSSETSDDKNEKIKALNTQFVAMLNKNHKEGHVAKFTEAAKKYIEYYDKIERGEIRIPDNRPVLESKSSQSLFGNATKSGDQPTPVSKPQPAVETKPESDSSSDSEDEIKVEGPKFTLNAKPTAKNSPFSFGPKPAKKVDSDSDSESEVEIKGPTFNFNKPIKDNVFKLDGAKSATNNESNNSTPDSKQAFSFGSSTAGKKDEPKPAFSFGVSAAEKKDEPKPAFSFGGSEKKDEPKPAFSFGGSEKKDEPKPAFSFGASSFGASTTEKKDESKPAFTFGVSAEKKDESKPGFSFGTSTTEKKDEPKPTLSFGASATDKKDEPKPAFSFASSTQKTDESKPAFSFGSATNNENRGMFSGSSTSDSTPKLFSFGSENKDTKEEEKPKSSLQFSFNPPSQTLSEKPAFSFGSSKSATPLFGNNNSTPSFTFNANNNKNEAESNSATPETQQGADPSEEDTGGDFKAVAQLSSEKLNNQTGEEDEEALYTKRTKLMLFDPSNSENPYTSRGLGDLKVLKNKATGKSRIVVRAEGGLRILLNTLVNKDMTYTTIGNGSMVRVPTVNPTDKSIETYILKVKTADDGQRLLEVLNDAKK